jgi:hypothetical protein
MKQKPLHLKKIDSKETVFYWFNLEESTYALYDSDMGEPISYGSLNLVVGTIRAINKEVTEFKRRPCVLWYFERDGTQGWRKKTPPVLFNWNPSAEDKRKQSEPDKNKA